MLERYYSRNFAHHGILGMKWGVRRYQNTDGTLTEEGKKRYGDGEPGEKKKMSTGKKVAIGVGIAAGAAAVAGAAALIATGKYKEIPDLINRGKEKVQMALTKKGLGSLVTGKEEWKKQVEAARKTRLPEFSDSKFEVLRKVGNERRVSNDPWRAILRAKTGMTFGEFDKVIEREGSLARAAALVDDLRRSDIEKRRRENLINSMEKITL